MPLKKTLTAEEYAALSDGKKEAYVQEDDKYVLDFDDGDEAVLRLKRTLAREKEDGKKFRDEVAKLKTDLEELRSKGDDPTNSAIKNNDILALQKTLEAQNKKAIDERDKKLAEEMAKTDKFLKSTKVETLAVKLAGKKAKVLSPTLEQRIIIDRSMGDPRVVVLDDNGEPTWTLEDLEKSIVDDKDFHGILVGTKAAGSGATGNNSGSGATTAKTYDELLKTSPGTLVKMKRENPAEYEKLRQNRS